MLYLITIKCSNSSNFDAVGGLSRSIPEHGSPEQRSPELTQPAPAQPSPAKPVLVRPVLVKVWAAIVVAVVGVGLVVQLWLLLTGGADVNSGETASRHRACGSCG